MDENEKKPSGEALSLDQLGEVTGGGDWGRHCPKCGTAMDANIIDAWMYWHCPSCGHSERE